MLSRKYLLHTVLYLLSMVENDLHVVIEIIYVSD